MADDEVEAGKDLASDHRRRSGKRRTLAEFREEKRQSGLMAAIGKKGATYNRGEILKFIGQELKTKLDEAKRQGEVEFKEALGEIHRDWIKNKEELKSKFGIEYPENNSDFMREARRASVDQKTILDLMIEGCDLELQDQPESVNGIPPQEADPPKSKGTVNARMLEAIQKNPEMRGWKSREWAGYLKCAKSTLVATDTWKSLATIRGKLSAEKAKDRRGRNVPRRRPETSD